MKCCKKAEWPHDLGPICPPAIEMHQYRLASRGTAVWELKLLFNCVSNTLFLNTYIKIIQFDGGNFNGCTKQF